MWLHSVVACCNQMPQQQRSAARVPLRRVRDCAYFALQYVIEIWLSRPGHGTDNTLVSNNVAANMVRIILYNWKFIRKPFSAKNAFCLAVNYKKKPISIIKNGKRAISKNIFQFKLFLNHWERSNLTFKTEIRTNEKFALAQCATEYAKWQFFTKMPG